jgi:hypothetical protein
MGKIMTRSILACAAIFAISTVCSAASAQIYSGGGDAADKYSCFGDCGGASRDAAGLGCDCSDSCLARGNCCMDREEFCTPDIGQPVCSLTANAGFGSFCGTDLGVAYPHAGQYEVLFGDSWDKPTSGFPCVSRSGAFPYSSSDDSQGTLPITRPSTSLGVPTSAAAVNQFSVQNCQKFLTFDMTGNNFTTVLLHDENTNAVMPMTPNRTPLAGFSDGPTAWGIFGQGGGLGDGPLYPTYQVYLAYRDTSRTDYRVRQNLWADANFASKFVNVSAARIASYNSTSPGHSNYSIPAGGGELLLFGRPSYVAGSTDPAPGLFLMRQTLPISKPPNAKNWAPQFFSGWTQSGDPTWSPNSSAAVSMVTSDFKVPNQIDIKFIPSMAKWVMLYGGDISWNQFYPNPLPPNDQPRHGAIHMRMADDPWGPWTRATPVLWREWMRGYIECDAPTSPGCDNSPFTTGTFKSNVSSVIDSCVPQVTEPIQPNLNCAQTGNPPHEAPQRGIMYAPEMLVTWTHAGTYDSTMRYENETLYFLVSTWMPYQVVLAAADLHWSPQKFNRGVQVQLRDAQKKMVANGTTTVSHTAGGTLGGATAWKVELASGATEGRKPVIGDIVTFKSVADGGKKYLSRSGNTVTFVNVTSPPPASVQWVIVSADTTHYPTGWDVEWGKTPIYLRNQNSSTQYLRSINGTLSNAAPSGGPGTDAKWTMTWGCVSGDTCVQ